MQKISIAVKQFFSMDGSLFRYSISFCVLMALFPTLIVLVNLFQNEVLDIHSMLPTLYRFFPKELIEPFIDYIITQKASNFASLITSFVITCYLASRSFYSLMLISSQQEEFITYKFLIRIKSMLLFVTTVFVIALSAWICTMLDATLALTSVIATFVGMYVLYRMLSFKQRGLLYGIIGALFSSLGILLVGTLFSYIVSRYMSYQSVYGPLSSLMTLMLTIYVISNVLYFGYCLNYAFVRPNEKLKYKNVQFYRTGEKMIDSLKKVVKRK